jgi:hypothetical protein
VKARLLLAGAMLLATVTASSTASANVAPLSIRVSPTTSFAPANLFVQVMIERNADNRWMRIMVESPEYFSSSEAALNGANSPRLRVIMFRDLPAGTYELRGEVFGERGRVRVSARTSALVVGR